MRFSRKSLPWSARPKALPQFPRIHNMDIQCVTKQPSPTGLTLCRPPCLQGTISVLGTDPFENVKATKAIYHIVQSLLGGKDVVALRHLLALPRFRNVIA